jgi:hypothetical protein
MILKKILNTRTLIIFLLLVIFVLFAKLREVSQSNTSLKNYNNIKEKEVKVWQDNYGYWRSKAEASEITKDNLKDLEELKNLSKDFEGVKKSLRNLENYIATSTSTTINKTINLKDTTIYRDSIAYNLPSFRYDDKWTTINGLIENGKVDVMVSSRDSLDIVQYWDRKWFLGRKKYFTEVKSFNPNTKVDYQKNIKVKRKRGLFAL